MFFDADQFMQAIRNVVREELQTREQEKIKLYTPTEACELLNISKSTLQRWTRQGLIKAVIIPGSRPRYSVAEIERLIKAQG